MTGPMRLRYGGGMGLGVRNRRQPATSIATALVFATLFIVATVTGAAEAAEPRPLTVLAAASMAGALEEVAALYRADGHDAPRLVFASSGVLARQIESGAPADLYISANRRWMDWLEERGMTVGRAVSLLGNRLVLIQPAEASVVLTLDATLPRHLAGQRLALGDPDHVPAGIYGKAALQSLGLWDALEDRIVRMPNVRAALLLVERGEAAAGIVYATDAAISPRVRVAADFPADSHPPIDYPVAVVSGGRTAAADDFLRFLQSEPATAVFRRHGFAVD